MNREAIGGGAFVFLTAAALAFILFVAINIR